MRHLALLQRKGIEAERKNNITIAPRLPMVLRHIVYALAVPLRHLGEVLVNAWLCFLSYVPCVLPLPIIRPPTRRPTRVRIGE